MSRFYKGSIFSEQERDGWIYGSFMPDGFHKDDRAEIKVKTLKKCFTGSPHYQKTATKLDIIWKGEAVWEVNAEDIELHAGDYLVIPPKVTTTVKKIITDEVVVQTIKIPSVPNDKVIGE